MRFPVIVSAFGLLLAVGGILRVGWGFFDVMTLPAVADDLRAARGHHIAAILTNAFVYGGALILAGGALGVLVRMVLVRRQR